MANLITVSDDDLALQCFYRWERERPSDIFLTQPFGGGAVREFSWSQAADETRRMARWLQSQGWPAGSKIAILGKNSAHWVLSDLAIWMAGHVSVPIYPTFNSEAVRYILQHSESKVCFVGKLDDVSALKDGVPPGVTVIALPLAPKLADALSWDALMAESEPLTGTPRRAGQEVATIIYTSGTTGQPKGVMHNFAAMAWAVSSGLQRVKFSDQERLLSYLPLAHVAERILVEQGVLRKGGHIFFAESLDTFVQDMARARPTVFFSVPRLWVKFQQGVFAKMPPAKLKLLLGIPLLGWLVRRKLLKGLGLDQCRLALGGAAPMPPDLLRWFRDLGLDLLEGYGMTENCAVSHSTLPGTCRPGTVGLPYEGVQSRIDPVTGEVQMRSPGVMMGYYKDAEQTAASISADGWLHTGDKGVLEADGALRITGRVKDIFKTAKGEYVVPAPIEDMLVTHPDIEACSVTGGGGFAQALGIIMLSAEAAQRLAQSAARADLTNSLKAHLQAVNARLRPHEQLDCLVVVTTAWTPENGVVTPTFKVKRPKIEELYARHYAAWFGQRQLVVWAQV
jgi:long-chain acyl-CoA synthetase